VNDLQIRIIASYFEVRSTLYHKRHDVHVREIKSRTDIDFCIVCVFAPTTIISYIFKLQNYWVYSAMSPLRK